MIGEKILLSMGAGGRLSQELMEKLFLPIYGNKTLAVMDDSAELKVGNERLAFTTDSYTVKPIFFPGGDIGKLAVCGTINDLTVKGAKPVAISAGFIIEEGFSIEDLKRIADSMKKAAHEAGVEIVTGDTKIVRRGEVDGIFINTAGIGRIIDGMDASCRRLQTGDKIIVTGSLANHGMSIMNSREGLGFTPEIMSDVAPLVGILECASPYGDRIHAMRDATRGGLAAVLNEMAGASQKNIKIFENSIPVKKETLACCDILGMDPLYIANEGCAVMFVEASIADEVLALIKALPIGKDAAIVGVVEDTEYDKSIPPVAMETKIGGRRFVPQLEGESLPRIC